VEIEIGPARTDGELTGCIEAYNAVWTEEPLSLVEAHEWAEWLREGEFLLARDDEGRPVGMALLGRLPHLDEVDTRFCVAPALRRHGIGGVLYAAVSRWAAARGHAAVYGSTPADDEESLAWAARRGFEPVLREERVVLELARAEPGDPAHPDVEIATLAERPDLAPALYELYGETWADVPGEEGMEMPPFDAWWRSEFGSSGDRPEAVFLAVAGERLVGSSKLTFMEARPDTAWNDLTGVARAWRGRGIARALKNAQIRWAAEQGGLERLMATNADRNEAMRRLNASLGYRPAGGLVRLRGPLAPATV
jgi:GNAT superfamily N-acetyltransferase